MQLGLIGKSLRHSFSKAYFRAKFEALGLDYRYDNYELAEIEEFPQLIAKHQLKGLNVTIPYKQEVLKYIDLQSPAVRAIGACNTLVYREGAWEAHNTDYLGFRKSLEESGWQPSLKRALVLGSGGASKAVVYALRQMGIKADVVGRKGAENQLSYPQAQSLISHYDLVVNTTPLGTYPNIDELAPLRPEGNLKGKLFFDLIYNPEKTAWLELAEKRGAQILNGRAMLEHQAEAAWKIWQQA